MALCGRVRLAVALLVTALVATPLPRLPELASISAARGRVDFSALPAIERFQARDGTGLAFPPLSGQRSRHRARRHRGARLVRLQRRHHPRAVGRWPRAASKPSRSTCAATARRARAAISAMSASSRTTSPISSPIVRKTRADGAADAGRPFLGRRLCAARGRLADPGFVRAHRAARALSRQRCPLQPAEFRRLGESRHSAHHRPVRLLRPLGITCCGRCRCWRFAVPPNSEKALVGDLYRSG